MKIAFCIPGDHFSKTFLNCWTSLVNRLDRWVLEEKRGEFEYTVHQHYRADMYHVRNGLVVQPMDSSWVELDKLVPFVYDKGGQYDYSMWIDSDMVFTPEDFFTLYETAINAKVDMITGFYIMRGIERASVVGYFGDKGGEHFYMDKIAENDTDKNGLIPVDFSGFGWVLIRTEVFNRMTYPYFFSSVTTKSDGNVKTFPTSDIYFFKRAKQHGFQLYAHPKVIIGHEKTMVLK